ncbi:Auxin-induced protein 22D [Acorus calamus]|uniref:Auxin-responsive protein n=1 Tax=Acorus calamus TaxID=4465 RepID=A0AAV9D8Z4_ACOCL|nr:Auxin-induced protein 22D [Acorus calamus]
MEQNGAMALEATELRLGLPGTDPVPERQAVVRANNKRLLPDAGDDGSSNTDPEVNISKEATPASKAQIVGWPPIRSYRKNSFNSPQKSEIYVKVSMDGAPYLRKIDLKLYKGYSELRRALEGMFKCFTSSEFPVKEASFDRSEHAITYEDKDGDWMLVGDVPWEMFITSCKRLRIMKGSEARGLNPST